MNPSGEALKKEIEEFADDWHWDEKSEHYAFEMAKFLFSFMDFLKDQNLSERTLKKHSDNVYYIGMFEMQYGYWDDDPFYPENLEGEPDFVYEYEWKISDSPAAVQSYESTWRKLDRYIKSGAYEKYLQRIEDQLK